ncbi:Hypothetical predicted protein [Scomber scombrus]|uniref:Uncharacterized protein n=1 Tax=Scomber scombrus TaxID=13677 RepID=A0AAV1PKL6_SCOSC
MMTAWLISGASLFALLIVDTCCLPVKQGPKSSASQNYNDVAPFAGSSQIGVQREPAASFGSSSSSGPALSGYRGGSVRLNPASSAHSGAAFQPSSGDMNWAVAPLSVSAGMERSAGTPGVGSSGPVNVSPPIYPPPPPAYQAGELSHLEEAFEHGDYETETEDQGFYAPPPLPMQASAGQAFTSQPLTGSGLGRYWGGGYRGGYPYYDYMFLTGQYPPGTYTHLSFNQEQGMDNWEDAHYRRYYPAQQTETVAVPQRSKDPRPALKHPVKAHYGHGGAAAGVSAPPRGSFMQPAGGYDLGKRHGY